jgi:hypothetical protein
VIPEIRLVVCANAADNADNGWLGITDVWLVTTDRFECDAIISCARAGRAGGVLSISIGLLPNLIMTKYRIALNFQS